MKKELSDGKKLGEEQLENPRKALMKKADRCEVSNRLNFDATRPKDLYTSLRTDSLPPCCNYCL